MSQIDGVSEGALPTYAIAEDFCRVFGKDMNSLYLLAFLLTADDETAERCFVRGLEDSVKANRVFREWVRSWARRTIIQSAVRIVQPKRQFSRRSSPRHPATGKVAEPEKHWRLAAILGLNTFERFVFVMSVLERLSDQDCKILLGCSREAVVAARARAVKSIAASEEAPALRIAPVAEALLAQAG